MKEINKQPQKEQFFFVWYFHCIFSVMMIDFFSGMKFSLNLE